MKKSILGALFLLASMAGDASAANCFWVGGTASLTPVNASSWSSSSGGAGSSCAAAGGVPATSSDTATWDSSSGGGTVTLNFGGTWTINSITIDSFTGTWDNSANNNPVNIAGASSAFLMVGSGTRTVNLGTATYTFAANSSTTAFSVQGSTNLTLSAASSTIVFASDDSQRTIGLSNKTFGTLTLGASPAVATGSYYNIQNSSAGPTITTLNISTPNFIIWPSSALTTITNPVAWAGTYNSGILFSNTTLGIDSSIDVPLTSTGAYIGFRGITFATTGGGANKITCTNCVNSKVGNVTFVQATSGTVACILGGWLLWRDMPEHINDNFPAWLEKAA